MSKYILSIDQGTTGTTVSLIDAKGQVSTKVNEEFPQIFPQPGWVEHNPEDIWASVRSTMKKALTKAKVPGHKIAAIGITNQRETVVVWNKKTGKPIHNAIVWQCRRTTPFCEQLKKKKLERVIKRKTGLVVDAYFSGSKIKWLLDNVSGARAKAKNGELLAGTIDAYLVWKLTNGRHFKTDVTNASRTMLMNLKTAAWDDELLKIFKVPKDILPEIVPSSGDFGTTVGLSELPDGIPIAGIAGDQQAALFGQTCFKPGDAKCTYGTGSFLLMNTGDQILRSKAGLLTTVAWQLKDQKKLTYALEGGAFICGAAVQWLRDELEFVKASSEIEALAKKVDSSEGVEFVPALTGLGAPHWQPEARGMISGLTRGSNRSHIARATLEGMALQNVDILLAMQKDLGKKMKTLRVDGGAAANNLLMQIQADYLGVQILRPKIIETTSAGAAYLAGLGVGFWRDLEEIRRVWQIEKEFDVEWKAKERKLRLEAWHKAIKRATF